MSSSTSSSKAAPGRRVLLCLALLFVVLELFTRFKLFDMSKDFRRFKAYPVQARELARSDGYRVALIGNSATDRGVDAEVFAAAMAEARGGPVAARKFVADQSRLNTWQYLLRRYFWKPGNQPDLLVINYYEANLEDGQEIEIGRLAQFFTRPDDWPVVLRHDVRELHQQVEFLISSGWATYAARERIKERVLKLAIPGYEEHAAQVNGVIFRHRKPSGARQGKRTYRTLRRVLDTARAHNARLCFVAYPTLLPEREYPYEIDPEARRMIEAAGMNLVDLRKVPGLEPADYADEVHLKEEAMPFYSRKLAEAVGSISNE